MVEIVMVGVEVGVTEVGTVLVVGVGDDGGG